MCLLDSWIWEELCKLVALKITSLMTKLANSSLLHIYYSWKNNKDLISYELSYQNMENFWLSYDQPISGPFSLTFSRGGNMPWGRRWIEPNCQMNQYIFFRLRVHWFPHVITGCQLLQLMLDLKGQRFN